MITTSPVNLDGDLYEVLAVHRQWWEANCGLDIAKMQPCFAGQDKFVMFNLNGFQYFSVDELTTLWQFLDQQDVDFRNVSTRILRYEKRADTLWLAAEVATEVRTVGAVDFAPRLLRSTEIYHREDAEGWRMWHFHCSDHAEASRIRYGFTDSFHDRGLGGNPYREPIVGVPGA